MDLAGIAIHAAGDALLTIHQPEAQTVGFDLPAKGQIIGRVLPHGGVSTDLIVRLAAKEHVLPDGRREHRPPPAMGQ